MLFYLINYINSVYFKMLFLFCQQHKCRVSQKTMNHKIIIAFFSSCHKNWNHLMHLKYVFSSNLSTWSFFLSLLVLTKEIKIIYGNVHTQPKYTILNCMFYGACKLRVKKVKEIDKWQQKGEKYCNCQP